VDAKRQPGLGVDDKPSDGYDFIQMRSPLRAAFRTVR
jgi:hypothetical protein